MSSLEVFISSPPCTCADVSDYVRLLVSATLLVGCVAGGAVLKFDQFYHSSF